MWNLKEQRNTEKQKQTQDSKLLVARVGSMRDTSDDNDVTHSLGSTVSTVITTLVTDIETCCGHFLRCFIVRSLHCTSEVTQYWTAITLQLKNKIGNFLV